MNETTDANAIFPPIWRRKWLILLTALLVAAGTYFYYKKQPATFQAATQVYLGAGAESAFAEKTSSRNPVTSGGNQAALINTVVVESAKLALRKSTVHIDKVAAKSKVKAKSGEKSQFITITAESHSARAAALLANTVAAAYVKRWTVHPPAQRARGAHARAPAAQPARSGACRERARDRHELEKRQSSGAASSRAARR